MRTLISRAILLAVTAVGFHTIISSSFAAAQDARAATFSERFAPVLNQMEIPAGAHTSPGQQASGFVRYAQATANQLCRGATAKPELWL
jgi:hypothetical protein